MVNVNAVSSTSTISLLVNFIHVIASMEAHHGIQIMVGTAVHADDFDLVGISNLTVPVPVVVVYLIVEVTTSYQGIVTNSSDLTQEEDT